MKPRASVEGEDLTNEAIRERRAYVVQQVNVTMENELYICGTQPLDPDNLMYGLI
jgi:hypothetical protein